MRVVSLLPAGTEIVAALGAAGSLVAVSHECDCPPRVAALPRVTASAVDAYTPARAVDDQVRALGSTGSPLFTVDEARIASLAPEVILTQAVCDVCAVSEADVRALAARLVPVPRIVTLAATTLDGVLTDIARVGEALEGTGEPDELVAGLRARIRHVHDRLAGASAPRPRVVVIEWSDPLYAAGHWVPEMVHRAGGADVIGRRGAHSRVVELGDVRRADPEVLVFAPCGYALDRAAEEGRRLLAAPGWEWAAGRSAWAVDANAMVSRPGPRLVDGIETLARIFHPTLFPPPLGSRAVRLA